MTNNKKQFLVADESCGCPTTTQWVFMIQLVAKESPVWASPVQCLVVLSQLYPKKLCDARSAVRWTRCQLFKQTVKMTRNAQRKHGERQTRKPQRAPPSLGITPQDNNTLCLLSRPDWGTQTGHNTSLPTHCWKGRVAPKKKNPTQLKAGDSGQHVFSLIWGLDKHILTAQCGQA